MRYEHLFFDLDHTLWDFETNAKDTLHDLYLQSTLKEIEEVDFESFYARYSAHNEKLWDLYTKGRVTQSVLKWKRISLTLQDFKIPDDNLSKKMSDDFLELLPTKNKVFDHTYDVLDYLQEKGYKMSLVTNGFEGVQQNKVKNSHLEKYFDFIVTSESANCLKPQAGIFKDALRQANVRIDQGVMIGDNQDADIYGAKNVGLDTIFVNHIHAKKKIEPTFMVHNLLEMKKLL